MRYGRIRSPAGQEVAVTFADGEATDPRSGTIWDISEVDLLPPVMPSKLIYVGMNYRDHVAELGVELPKEPVVFFKPTSALIAHGEQIVLPRESSRVDYEGELAVVIGRDCRGVTPGEVPDVLAGFTITNDVTARDFQAMDTQWTKAKAWDTFAPVGPWVESDISGASLEIRTLVNGLVVQESNTENLIFDVPQLIAYISRIMSLFAGDIIATGTPAGVGCLFAGDTVDVEVAGIGVLRNPVVAEVSPLLELVGDDART